MKHKLISLGLIAAVFAGCTVKKNMEFAPVDNTGYTLICADIQSLLFMEGTQVWPEDAAIGVYGSEKGENEFYTMKEAGAGYSAAFFYGPLVKGQVTAYYPYSSSYVGSADAMPVAIEKEQKFSSERDAVAQYLAYTPQSFGYQSDGKIRFVYPTGLFSLNFEGDEPVYVTDISVTSQSESISGMGVFRADGTMDMTNNSFNYVQLDCGDGVPSVSNGQSTNFYIILAPGTYSDLKLSIGFKENDKKFICEVPEITIDRIDENEFKVSSLKISVTVPDDFEEVDKTFDE